MHSLSPDRSFRQPLGIYSIRVPGKSILQEEQLETRQQRKGNKTDHQRLALPRSRWEGVGGERKEFRGMKLEDAETLGGKVALTGDSAC